MTLNPLQSSQKKYLSLQLGYNPSVDFCIWVLTKDRLQVPPFSHHYLGKATTLSSLGLNAENWESWVRSIIIKKDPRLISPTKHIDSIESFKKHEIEKYIVTKTTLEQKLDELSAQHRKTAKQSTKKLGYSSTIDWRIALEAKLTLEYQRHQRALALIEQLPQSLQEIPDYADPPEFWLGNQAIKEQLTELWYEYQEEQSERHSFHKMLQDITSRWYNSYPTSNFDSYAKDLDWLKFYLVVYPEIVEYPIPPISVIKSVKLEVDPDPDWEDSLRRGVLALVEKCSS